MKKVKSGLGPNALKPLTLTLSLTLFTVLNALSALSGCSFSPSTGRYKIGEILIAQNWREENKERNGEEVEVTGSLDWRQIKNSNPLRVYEVRTIDGKKFAAQEFQLRRLEK